MRHYYTLIINIYIERVFTCFQDLQYYLYLKDSYLLFIYNYYSLNMHLLDLMKGSIFYYLHYFYLLIFLCFLMLKPFINKHQVVKITFFLNHLQYFLMMMGAIFMLMIMLTYRQMFDYQLMVILLQPFVILLL